ncbi:MAG TPA: deoxyribonuclease IV [Chthoniobacterales bacterium]|nr:deoxyribonuclease IV [Chthoniobacterales bacterium]
MADSKLVPKSGRPKAARTAKNARGLLLGAHMSISGGPSKALERGHSIGCTAIQIFVKNNMQWFAKPLAESELVAFRTFPEKPKIVFGHTSYLINLAANNDDFLQKSRQALKAELERADQLELPFLVLHPGSHLGAGIDAGIRLVAKSLDAVFAELPKGRCKVALEITAGQGSCLGHTFGQLAGIIAACRYPKRLLVCLDTAHIFAAGYDISSATGFWRTFEQFEQEIGMDRLAAWHLNDSKAALGSRVDRHDHIGKGKIGTAPFQEIIRSARFAHLPKVLETPKKEDLAEDRVNLALLRSFVK